MKAPDLTAFIAAATAVKAVAERIERSRLGHEETWRTKWEEKHDRFHDLAMRAPTGATQTERWAWMERNHPDACRDRDAAEHAVTEYVLHREADMEAFVKQKRLALALLGTAFSERVLAIAHGADCDDVQSILASIMTEATAIRRQHLDAGRLDFDETGPFTRALLEPAAMALGIDIRRRHWPSETLSRLSNPVPSPTP